MKNPILFRKIAAPFFCALLVFSLCVVSPQGSYGIDYLDPFAEDENAEIHLVRGDLEAVSANSLERVSVSNPDIADVVDADGDDVLILAKKAGQTAVFLWDSEGKHTYIVRVFEQDLKLVETRIRNLIGKANIHGVRLNSNPYEGKVVLTGTLPTEKKEELDQILDPFHLSVINMVREEVVEDLVQIDVQIVELNSTVSGKIGFDWMDSITITETTPNFAEIGGNVGDLFRIGELGRTGVSTVINMLVQEGKGRVLSKPKLVVLSGKEASFLVGGEVPVTSTTTLTSGAQQENVEYRDFGVSLAITPVIREDNKIDVFLEIEVSELDGANRIGTNFAFTTRTAQTQLYLDDQQTIVLAGLIKQNKTETVDKVPFLSEVPFLGALFRSKDRPSDGGANTDTELVISLTPKIIRQSKKIGKAMSPIVPKMSSSVSSNPAPAAPMVTKNYQQAASFQRVTPHSMGQYIQAIQSQIANAIIYPDEAQINGWEGTVKLALHVLNDGTLARASIKKSSGYSLFDEGALMAARTTAPYSIFPSEADFQDINVTVPVVYSLERQ